MIFPNMQVLAAEVLEDDTSKLLILPHTNDNVSKLQLHIAETRQPLIYSYYILTINKETEAPEKVLDYEVMKSYEGIRHSQDGQSNTFVAHFSQDFVHFFEKQALATTLPIQEEVTPAKNQEIVSSFSSVASPDEAFHSFIDSQKKDKVSPPPTGREPIPFLEEAPTVAEIDVDRKRNVAETFENQHKQSKIDRILDRLDRMEQEQNELRDLVKQIHESIV